MVNEHARKMTFLAGHLDSSRFVGFRAIGSGNADGTTPAGSLETDGSFVDAELRGVAARRQTSQPTNSTAPIRYSAVYRTAEHMDVAVPGRPLQYFFESP
jgi:hypothetical protein